ncbi:hypothetical protein [Fibrobacter intestinalis]|uniref:hypothetical protein n=1 Tax=Fibrobacter sp. NR9 TaxID=1896200 RepID=UPI00117AE379|nr:hypothetical protein [Fibrobacter sp. NR9]
MRNFLHSMNFSSKREFLFGTKMFLPALYCLRRLNSGGFSKIRFRQTVLSGGIFAEQRDAFKT